MGKPGAGIIGLGVGRHHCEGYAASEDVDFLAVCDLIPERRAWAETTYGVDAYDDLDAFLARDDIQVVSVCTPDYTHLDVARRVLAADKHLYLEKPIEITLEKALALADLAAASSKQVGIAYEFRINPMIVHMKQAVDSGRLGKVAAFSMYDWRGPFGRNKWGKWIQSEDKSGGMIVEEVCHWFDLLRFIGGEIEEVHCVCNDWVHEDFDFEDVAFINARFASGAAAHITHSLCGYDLLFDLWLTGTQMSVRALHKERLASQIGVGDGRFFGLVSERRHWKPADFGPEGNLREGVEETFPVTRTTYGPEIKEAHLIAESARLFAKCAVEGRPFPVTVDDGVRSLIDALAARKSAKENRPVRCDPGEVRGETT